MCYPKNVKEKMRQSDNIALAVSVKSVFAETPNKCEQIGIDAAPDKSVSRKNVK